MIVFKIILETHNIIHHECIDRFDDRTLHSMMKLIDRKVIFANLGDLMIVFDQQSRRNSRPMSKHF